MMGKVAGHLMKVHTPGTVLQLPARVRHTLTLHSDDLDTPQQLMLSSSPQAGVCSLFRVKATLLEIGKMAWVHAYYFCIEILNPKPLMAISLLAHDCIILVPMALHMEDARTAHV